MGRQQGQIRLCMRSEGVIDRMTDIQVEDKVPRMWNKCKRIFFWYKGGYKSQNELNYWLIALVNTVGKVF